MQIPKPVIEHQKVIFVDDGDFVTKTTGVSSEVIKRKRADVATTLSFLSSRSLNIHRKSAKYIVIREQQKGAVEN